MSDQVDEDALSVQLESSLTLEDEEDLITSPSKRESHIRSEERKNVLDTIFTPVKSSPFSTDKDLRREVLIRNLKTTPIKGQADVTDFNLNSSDCTYHMQPEKDQDNQGVEESAPGGDSAHIHTILKPEVDNKTCLLENEEYIIVDETFCVDNSVIEVVDISSPLAGLEEEKPVKNDGSLDVSTSRRGLEKEVKTEKKVVDVSVDNSVVEVVDLSSPLSGLEEEEKPEKKRSGSVQDEVHVANDTQSAFRPDVEVTESSSAVPQLGKEEKPGKKPSGLDVDYVSKDPLENADNNNPDWQLLQKLETDEERYKAVRERWRNLIVPEPNKDLTCFAWCRKNYSEPKNPKDAPVPKDFKNSHEDDHIKGRKRTFSACAVDSPVRRGREMRNAEKRVRTVSCTRVYDDKIATLRRHASEECLKIDRERMYALEGLEKEYLSVKRSISNWCLNTGSSVNQQLNDLDRYHYQKRKNLAVSFEDLSSQIWEKKVSEINALETAAAEVLAFHKFYQGLDSTAPESMVLTEEQMEEINEINSMYEAFNKFYEE